jgi:hypothetical protein
MARATDLSYTSVQRIWKAHELKPHLVKTFKLSNDKRFVEKVQDIVGLYLDPPDKALVFRSTKKARSRRWTVRSTACRSRKADAAP